MTDNAFSTISRRRFIIGAAAVGTGLTIVAACGRQRDDGESAAAVDGVALEWQPQPYLHIGDDSIVTIFSKSTEMGQGVFTGFATLVAEELDADWAQIRVQHAPSDDALYGNLDYGIQITGASNSIATSFDQMRQVGAAARRLLVAAAAAEWQVPANEISVQRGRILHAESGQEALFGDFAEAAARQSVPAFVQLKDPDRFELIGNGMPRVDVAEKTDGRAIFTQDLRLPDMLTAVVAHAPRFGTRVASFDATAAKAMPGVVDVVEIPTGVAAIARDFWTASRARDRLEIQWDDSDAFDGGSAQIFETYSTLADEPGTVVREVGSANAALQSAAKTVEAEFRLPYLAHAPLEPLNCIVQWTGDACELWSGSQSQSWNRDDAVEILGVNRDAVTVNTLYAGGGFGRRSCWDIYREALHIVKAMNTRLPVRLQWTREDDLRAGEYRPLTLHRLRGGLDEDGQLVAWQHRIVGQSISEQKWPGSTQGVEDEMTMGGASNWLYEVPNILVDQVIRDYPVPVLWLRGVAHTHNVFTVETFVDELASAAGRDPVEFRRAMLSNDTRMRAVLDLAVEKSGGLSAKQGRGRGVAICKARGTYIAQVAEITARDASDFSVDRVVTAVDCGIAVNPDNVRSQVEGGTGFALSTILGEEITVEKGAVRQSNFDSYPLLRIDQMPEVEVHLVDSREAPGGIGEVGAMTVGAAVANAIRQSTGQSHRLLPLRTMA